MRASTVRIDCTNLEIVVAVCYRDIRVFVRYQFSGGKQCRLTKPAAWISATAEAVIDNGSILLTASIKTGRGDQTLDMLREAKIEVWKKLWTNGPRSLKYHAVREAECIPYTCEWDGKVDPLRGVPCQGGCTTCMLWRGRPHT